MKTLLAFLTVAKELLHWRRVEAEISARRLLFDVLKEGEDGIDDIENEIERLQESSDPIDLINAQRMLHAQVQRACLNQGILDVARRADIQISKRHNFGKPAHVSEPTEGQS